VDLLIQPGDSVRKIIRGIAEAKKSVEIVIFRCNRKDIEHALESATSRGVFTRALIAHTNHGGEVPLRRLEMRLLGAGVTVARTADDLLRYHYKMIIIDHRVLYLLAFNFTYLDIERSRSFGVITSDPKLVQEAVKLFEADTRRQPYTPSHNDFIVSPVNAREQLASFISGAHSQLLVYDFRISDRAMVRLLEDRARAGVEVKIIGNLARNTSRLQVRSLPSLRVHARTILRDAECAFIGSQSLRHVELDKRREVGLIFRDRGAVNRLIRIFEDDWALSYGQNGQVLKGPEPASSSKAAKKIAKAIANDLPPVSPVLKQAVKEVVGKDAKVELNPDEVEKTVKNAVKEAVREVVEAVVDDAANRKEIEESGK
jgi:cardiolipin synthase